MDKNISYSYNKILLFRMFEPRSLQYILINDNATLLNHCQKIEKSQTDYISVDTEFIRLKKHFLPIISTIQIEYLENIIIVDLLSPEINDYDCLNDIFTNRNIIKLFFDYNQDIPALSNIITQIPYPVIDVQKAMKFLSNQKHSIGYANIIKDILGIEINKIEKRSDWLQRPLTKNQLDYAATDVLYLHKIFLKIKHKLMETKRMEWLLEDMELNFNFDDDAKQAQCHYHRSFHILKKLRYEISIQNNIDIQAVCNNINLMMISKNMVDYQIYPLQILKKTKFQKEDLNNIIKTELQNIAKPLYYNDTELNIINFIKTYIKIICKEHNISFNTALGGKTHIIYFIIQNKDLQIPIYHGWRYKLFGSAIKECLDGKKTIYTGLSFYDQTNPTLSVINTEKKR